MMPIDVTQKGAIKLGKSVTCDGFVYGSPIRVQTHIHGDHLADFETSKGCQTIITSDATKTLLILRFDAELPCRNNFKSLPLGTTIKTHGIEIELLSSGHMIGATQVAVITEDGKRIGYSGDFSWPLDKTIEVDYLVVDSTYGSPDSIRRYPQEEVNTKFVELVLRGVKIQPVIIKAHPGTLQHALELLDGVLSFPILASKRIVNEAEVYRSYGYSISPIIDCGTPDGQKIMEEGHYVRVYSQGDVFPYDQSGMTSITISAYMTEPGEPLIQYSDNAFRIAISGHADFNGTIEYVAATKAIEVVTDNSRGGHGVELAIELRRRLSIEASPSSNIFDPHWGT